jgi:hypothetical protein
MHVILKWGGSLTLKSVHIFFAALLLSGSSIPTFGFAPVVNPSAVKPILSAEDQVTLANPLTHGDFTPRQTGHLDFVPLKFEGNRVNWLGSISDRGVLQAWGSPFMHFDQDASIQDMNESIRQFLLQNTESFQVHPGELRLDPIRTKFSGPFRYVTYSRLHQLGDEGMVPVEGAFITFRFKYGSLIEITNFTFGRIAGVEPAAFGQEDAIDAVVEDSGFIKNQDAFSGRISKEVQPFYSESGQLKFRLVYEISLRKKNPEGLWKYSVDGADGKIVRLLNEFHTAGHVSAEVYSRLPGTDIVRVPVAEANVRSGGQVGQTDGEGNHSFDGGRVSAELSGRRAIVKESSSRLPSQTSNEDGEILFSASQNLSESMSYVYVNRINQFVRNFIKSAPRDTPKGKLDFLNSPLTINTRVQSGTIKGCNAWFDSEMKTLNFLEADARCEASSHFSDIIFHEWGHGLDDALGGIQDSAFSEGIGDVTAALMTGDSRIGPGFIKGRESPIRDIAQLRVYPKDRNRDPHLESLIISGAWFEVLQTMKKIYGDEAGRLKVAELFFKHLITTDSYLDSYMGALTVDDDDGNLSNCTPHMCVFNLAFARRGIAQPDPRCQAGGSQSQLPACAPSTVKPPTDQ